MERRRLLALTVALLGGCSDLPGATGPRTPPTPSEPTAAPTRSLQVTNLAVEEADDGHLRVVATVRNGTNAQRTRRLRIRVRAGEIRTEQQRDVTVPGGTQQDVVFDFADVQYEDFSGNGSLNSGWV
ncbi:transcriptional initiation protein Tat [Haloplanus rubicundus]|uniref:Transcriptional initiation protein Tat n=1 Tax=Haloplanus rubicundus TaxID=1547898 RepID=A0A345EDJ8_9EURY|nr:transcriptional initiation protein Tat [Haloplanus rubicundus]AXG10270.1 transcriptional initiation protein Tat [Haloplanus rubicundus]